MKKYLVGVDIGGTFTDCAVLDPQGGITATKSPSTPGNFAQGMIDALAVAAQRLDLDFETFAPISASSLMAPRSAPMR